MNYLVLDPNLKDAYAKAKWAPNFFKKGMKSLQKLVCFCVCCHVNI